MIHNHCDDGFAIRKGETGVGPVFIARCRTCNEEYDITDYDAW